MAGSLRVLSLEFHQFHMNDVIVHLLSRQSSTFDYVVTPNVDHMVRLHDRPELAGAYRGAWLRLCDSRVLSLLVRLFGLGTLPVVAGSDLTRDLLETPVVARSRICIIGASNETVQAVCKRYDLVDVLHFNPPMGFISDPIAVDECIAFAVGAQADWTFFAVGSPQQELLAFSLSRCSRARGIGLCIGASLLFLSGEERRAPAIIQVLHFEWLFRLMGNPRRLARRYLVDGPRIISLLWGDRKLRSGAR